MIVIEPIGKEKTEKGQQSQTVIVPNTPETHGDQQPNGEDANNFLFHGQDGTRSNQTRRK